MFVSRMFPARWSFVESIFPPPVRSSHRLQHNPKAWRSPRPRQLSLEVCCHPFWLVLSNIPGHPDLILTSSVSVSFNLLTLWIERTGTWKQIYNHAEFTSSLLRTEMGLSWTDLTTILWNHPYPASKPDPSVIRIRARAVVSWRSVCCVFSCSVLFSVCVDDQI